MKNKLFGILFVVALSLSLMGAGQYGGTWKREGTVVSPHDDVTSIDFSNLTGSSALDLDWDTNVGEVLAMTGVDEQDTGLTSCQVTVNAGDDSKVDIAPCHLHIQGPHYEFMNMTAINPGLGVGDNSIFIGMTMGGYTTSEASWTETQQKTIVPLARLNTSFGVSGPGSTISLIRDDRYFITQRDYYDRLWYSHVIGALYETGGDIFANATSGLILGQNSGTLYDSQTKSQTLATFENQSAVFLHLSSSGGMDWIGDKRPLVVDAVNYNPSGSGLTPMLNDNKFTVHTILKSPKGVGDTPEGGLFFIYGDIEYATQADALAAVTANTAMRWGLFVNQATSGLVPVALVIQQRNAVAVDTIIDKRPCLVCR